MKKAMLAAIRFYQRHISPGFADGRCKYLPTCSQYAYEAIALHGCLIGFLLAAHRILRCNPFSRGGYDPVPEKGKIWNTYFCRKHAGDAAPAQEDETDANSHSVKPSSQALPHKASIGTLSLYKGGTAL